MHKQQTTAQDCRYTHVRNTALWASEAPTGTIRHNLKRNGINDPRTNFHHVPCCFATPTTNFDLKFSQKLMIVIRKKGCKFCACSKDVSVFFIGNYVRSSFNNTSHFIKAR